jgi:hypothetical protein
MKQEGALSPLVLEFVLDCDIKKIHKKSGMNEIECNIPAVGLYR